MKSESTFSIIPDRHNEWALPLLSFCSDSGITLGIGLVQEPDVSTVTII